MKANNLWLRVLTAALCLCMVLSLAACGGGSSTSSETSGEVSAETTKPTKTKKPTKTTSTTTTAATGGTTAAGTTVATQQQQTTQKQTTTTAQQVNFKYDKTTKKDPVINNPTLKASDYIRNQQLHKTMYLSDTPGFEYATRQGFIVDSQHYELLNGDLAQMSLEEYGFYTGQVFPLKMGIGEWGFSFTQLTPGNKMGDGRVLIPETKYGVEKPKTRADSLRIIKDWMWKMFPDMVNDRWHSMNGYYLWNHYAGEWGAVMIGSETGESIGHTQASIAFTRGAGRQYGTPTFIDFSEWFRSTIPGHSASLAERTAMATYMGGIANFVCEGGCWYAICNNTTDKRFDGDYYALSATGKKWKSVIDFAEKYPNIGTAYTPFGIVMDYYHGIKARDDFSNAFAYFKYTDGDWMTYNLIGKFFPGGWTQNWDETTYMVNGPYGDTCDTLLQNASQEVLNSYPCLILAGDIKFSGEEKNRYVNYVKNGGTLVMNTAYLNYFTDYKNQYGGGNGVKEITDGKGKVIVYGPDFSLDAIDGIIKDQLAELLPFTFSTNIEYMVNIKDGTMYVTLINSDGVSKTPTTDAKLDSSKKKTVTVTFTGNQNPKSIKEIYKNAKVTVSGKAATITVNAGEVRVLEFKFD